MKTFKTNTLMNMLAVFVIFTVLMTLYTVFNVQKPIIYYEDIEEVRLSDSTTIFSSFIEYKKNGEIKTVIENRTTYSHIEPVYLDGQIVGEIQYYKGEEFPESYRIYTKYDKYGNWIEKVRIYQSVIDMSVDAPRRELDKVYSITNREVVYRD